LEAYKKRTQDAVPDEITVQSRSPSRDRRRDDSESASRPQSSSLSIPRTVVEKIDTDTPSYGEDPASPGYKTRMADAAPDYIFKVPSDGEKPRVAPVITDEPEVTEGVIDNESASPVEIPETRVSRVDTLPAKEKRRLSHRRNPSDAQPDSFEDVSETDSNDVKAIAAAPEPVMQLEQSPPQSQSLTQPAQDDFDDFNDDFDDFEAGEVNAAEDDDFGDFDDFETADDVADIDTTQEAHAAT
ncbi:hypothetical protein KEM56_005165, partial [Ascosphaera pollenicola]